MLVDPKERFVIWMDLSENNILDPGSSMDLMDLTIEYNDGSMIHDVYG